MILERRQENLQINTILPYLNFYQLQHTHSTLTCLGTYLPGYLPTEYQGQSLLHVILQLQLQLDP